MRILVTGCNGYIGSYLIRTLLNEGHSVIGIDLIKKDVEPYAVLPGSQMLPVTQEEWLSEKFVFLNGETSMPLEMLPHLDSNEKIDAVCHLAAQASVLKSVEDPIADANANIIETIRLLDATSRINVDRFVFASSGGCVYGNGSTMVPTHEGALCDPISPYGISKVSAEMYIKMYGDARAFNDVVILRYANVYGGPWPQTAKVRGECGGIINHAIRSFLHDKPVTLRNAGHGIRDYIHIKDVVDATVRALTKRVYIERTTALNIGTGVAHSTDYVVDKVAKAVMLMCNKTGVEDLIKYEVSDNPYEVKVNELNVSKARLTLPWRASVDLNDGIMETVRYYDDLKSAGEEKVYSSV